MGASDSKLSGNRTPYGFSFGNAELAIFYIVEPVSEVFRVVLGIRVYENHTEGPFRQEKLNSPGGTP